MNTKTTPFEAFAAEMRAITAKMRENGAITVIPETQELVTESKYQRIPKELHKKRGPAPRLTKEEVREREKQARARKRANGFCIFHRKEDVPVMEGRSLCEKCLEKSRLRYKPKFQRQSRYRRGESQH